MAKASASISVVIYLHFVMSYHALIKKGLRKDKKHMVEVPGLLTTVFARLTLHMMVPITITKKVLKKILNNEQFTLFNGFVCNSTSDQRGNGQFSHYSPYKQRHLM